MTKHSLTEGNPRSMGAKDEHTHSTSDLINVEREDTEQTLLLETNPSNGSKSPETNCRPVRGARPAVALPSSMAGGPNPNFIDPVKKVNHCNPSPNPLRGLPMACYSGGQISTKPRRGAKRLVLSRAPETQIRYLSGYWGKLIVYPLEVRASLPIVVERRDANLIQYADVIDRMDQGEQSQHAASNRPILMHLLSAPLSLLHGYAATLLLCLPRAPLPQWRFPSLPSARSHFYPNIDVTNATRKRPQMSNRNFEQ
ncbi:hypothetical protein BDP55DRAFT_752954 [Colletotrichum godetiae]|uniref:Uncharacterized protein n=1 Tax=Colletotrichum godetiae TaxID=1209918 RepID=A0AAJ0ERK9_9PEZI|nr:uncharacterized protein BDP55DRAFT_752954 [Colletotrichum godetiae]KAK1671453.1 hypothetical protein BDP55DRAFT_752954 [Colletotrichum godetiae]